jgi:hypothetical protein
MLKISILDTPSHRRLVVGGKLIAPWAAELRRVLFVLPDGRC